MKQMIIQKFNAVMAMVIMMMVSIVTLVMAIIMTILSVRLSSPLIDFKYVAVLPSSVMVFSLVMTIQDCWR